MGPLALDLPKGLVPGGKCEKTIGGLSCVFLDNPITNAKLAKKMSRRTDFKGKLVLGSYPLGYHQPPQRQDFVSRGGQNEDQQRDWLASTLRLDRGLKQGLKLWNRKTNRYVLVVAISVFWPFPFQGQESGIAALVTEVSDWKNPAF